MENQYTSMQNKLEVLRETLVQTIQSSNNNDELTKKLISLAAKDPSNSDVYQLILLVSSNTETNHNSFKQTSIRVITEIISQKLRLVDVLEKHDERIVILESKIIPTPKTIKIPMIGEIEIGVVKVKDILLFIVGVFVILVVMNHYDGGSVSKTISDLSLLIGK